MVAMKKVSISRLRLWLSGTRDWLPAATTVVLIAAALLALAFWVLQPTPPKRLVLATAGEQSAYQVLGQRYREALRPYGITVELRPTAGSGENLALMDNEDSGVDAAFLQGGTWQAPVGEDEPEVDLVSLGGLFHEPVWVFYREDSALRLLACEPPEEPSAARRGKKPVKLKLATAAIDAPIKPATHTCGVLPGLHALRGWKVNAGAEGSGVQVLARRLLGMAGLEGKELAISHLTNTPAVVELLEGKLDAMFFVSAPEASLIQMLLRTPGIKLMSFDQAQAYARKLPFLSAVTLPRGVVDLSQDLPRQDIHLVAATGTLVARDSMHPALVQLLVQAASRIHSSPGWFAQAGEFPRPAGSDLPLADEAQRFYKSGKPWMQRYMPFWLSNLIDRMWVALFSIIAVLIPLSRLVPPLYVFRIRSRIFRWYARLREIETESLEDGTDKHELLRELAGLETRVKNIQVPLSYADELYALRQNIGMVQQRIGLRLKEEAAT